MGVISVMTKPVTIIAAKNLLIDCDDIAIADNGRKLFEHTHWRIETGRHWAIIGPNRSGKSVLAATIAAKVPLVQGRILYYFEKDDTHNPVGNPYFHRGEIVLISPKQHQNLMRRWSGYCQARWQSFESDNSITVAAFLTGERIERISPFEVTPLRTDETVYRGRREKAMALLGIEYLLDRKIIHLSNGESRKVLIAQAMMQSPKLLILDEPFAGLDAASRIALQEAINLIIVAGQIQILLVTSRFEEIPDGMTDILSVADYRINYLGPKKEFNHQKSLELTASTERQISNSFPLLNSHVNTDYNILVEMKHVTVTYDQTKVLEGIDWTVKPGERWLVTGHNGAGKSTLLSLILGDNPQVYANNIKLFDKPVQTGLDLWEIKHRIGFLSPELALFYPGEWSCIDVVCSGFFDSIGLYRTCSRKQLKIAVSWLDYLGIDSLANLPLNMMASDEQRLVLLIRALVKNPALLILDEPCLGLDFSHRRQIINLLDELCIKNPELSFIYVTHHPDETPAAITHKLRMEKGRIIARTEATLISGIISPAKYLGRFDFSDPAGPIFAWPGSSITVRFEGSGISADFNPINGQDNWLNIIIDSNESEPIRIDSRRTYVLASGLVPGVHQLTLYKRTEALYGEIQFQGFKLPSQCKILEPLPSSERKIEIIGDSISCGYSNEANWIADGSKGAQENNYLAYGAITARNLNADLVTLAWSGKGLYQNYGGDKVEVMPELYRRTLPGRKNRWDFQAWTPDVVVINLGTNDFSGAVNKKAFSDAYRSLVGSIRQNYPNAFIFCAIGPLNLKPGKYIRNIVKQFNAGGDRDIVYLEFPRQDIRKNGIGGDNRHPSLKTHAAMAEQLTQEIRGKLGW